MLFGFNLTTFSNWINQPQYFAKWVVFVRDFQFSDVSKSIPLQYWDAYDYILPASKVVIPEKYLANPSGVGFVAAFGLQSAQGKKKAAQSNECLQYMSKTRKTVGSGRKVNVKFAEGSIFELCTPKKDFIQE